LSCPIVGSDKSCDRAVKLDDSWDLFLCVLFNNSFLGLSSQYH
jgi:hypothetical protein